ncbi:hypothetical protein KC343_g11920, partial [Hortaea werneckii]
MATIPFATDWTQVPQPTDDGACAHLLGQTFPSIPIPSTSGTTIDISALSGLSIIFFYPRTAAPNEQVPPEWNEIPGARGCTPQACSFRDSADDFLTFGVNHIFGCSTQSTSYQQELKTRTHLPYQILSDEGLALTRGLGLPTFAYAGQTLTKRVTLAVEDGKVVRVWY